MHKVQGFLTDMPRKDFGLSNIPGVIHFLNRPPSLFITGKSGLPGVFIIGESRLADDEYTGGVDQCVES